MKLYDRKSSFFRLKWDHSTKELEADMDVCRVKSYLRQMMSLREIGVSTN
jgi:hypothetical protein